MKIVQLCRLYLPHIGGVETHVAAVSRQLIADGHQVTVITTQDMASEPLTEVIDGVSVFRQPKKNADKKYATWKWVWAHQKLLVNADIVQVHDVAWWLTPVWPMVEDKTFITFHGWETTYPVRWQAKAQRWWFSFLSKGRVHVGDWIREFYWDKPNYVTYGGVYPEKKSTLINKSGKNKKVKITFVGRLFADNDIDSYIELAQILKSEDIFAEITWLGDGPKKNDCEKVGKVLGFVSDPDQYLAKSDVIWASSYLSILQAQSLGKIVCSFYSNKLKQRYLETYPASDLLLISDSPVIMVDKLKMILKQPEVKKQLEYQASVFARTQSWQTVSNMYYHLWGG